MSQAANPVKSVRTTMQLFEALRQHGGVGVTELEEITGISKGTVHNHLSTLREEDYVVKEDGKYYLGFRFLNLAHHAKDRVGIFDLVKQQADKLAAESGEMTIYVREEHGLSTCLYMATGENAFGPPAFVGQRKFLHVSAVGKSILAELPDERVREIIDEHGLQQKTEETITTEDALFEELETVRERGVAFNREESIPGLVGVGAPVTNQQGELAGAMSIIGPKSRLDYEERYEELADMITHSVNVIEINAEAT